MEASSTPPSSTSPGSTAAPPPRSRARRAIFAVIALVLGGLATRVVVRGTIPDAAIRNPETPEDGLVRQLILTPEGRKVVRFALVLDRSPAVVWKAVTSYGQFGEMFSHLASAQDTVDPDGRHHFQAVVTSPVGDWPIDVHVKHEETPERCVASWDEPAGKLVVNKGSWTVTPAGKGRALLVYTLDLEIAHYPRFVVRYALLNRFRPVMKKLGAWIEANTSGPASLGGDKK